MSDTLTLFDARDLVVRKPDTIEQRVDLDALNEYAFLYTITETGTATGIRFMATRDDAMRWCSSDLSHGVLHGTQWAYAWTSVANFLINREGWQPAHGGLPSLTLRLDEMADNGQWDERIASTGCRMIKLAAIPDLLRPLGVTVVLA